MNGIKIILLILITACAHTVLAQQYALEGTVRAGAEPVELATVRLQPGNWQVLTNENGFFRIHKLSRGTYTLQVSYAGYQQEQRTIELPLKGPALDIDLRPVDMQEVVIAGRQSEGIAGKLKDVVGTAIYAGKKTELINVKNLNANLATNNTRQLYARIPGLNIWEYDNGGLQLGIGGRGLSPNRSSNFNIRQNGYDISADALGYPESYYTPSAEALDHIEIIRGAASLQYGPQFGGLINFVMKQGPADKPIEFTTRQTLGSFGLFNSFTSAGGTLAKGKLNYYGFYQFKKADSWRPNSHFDQHNAYAHLAYRFTPKLQITGEYTFMHYLAQQPGGLTDAQFREDPKVSVRSRNWFRVSWNLLSLNLDYAFSATTRLNWRNFTLQGGREALGILSYINRPDIGGNRDMMKDRYANWGSELRFIHRYTLSGKNNSTFLVGARWYQGLTKRQQGDANDGSGADFHFNGPEPNKSGYRFPGQNMAAFAENIFQLSRRWSITPGIRFEHINTKAKGYYYKQNVFIDDDRIEEQQANPRSFVLLGIGTAYKFDNGTELYGNISQNYRSINFNDIRIINSNARVDPALRDETGFNIDLGFRGHYAGWLYADISAFYLKYNDRIGSIFTRDTSFMTYRLRTNVSDSRNLGLEFLLEADVLKALSGGRSRYSVNIYTNLSLIDAKYINTKNTAFAGKLVENVPPVLFRTGLSFGEQRFNISYQFSWQARQYSDATNTEETPTAVDGLIPAFQVMDLSLRYSWRKFTIYTGVNNLGDTKYFTRRADGYPGPGILPADPRNFYCTLQFKW
ncbi:MAG: TonB-dependent receptor [Candidatus Pseudobacter hemicellulosilyticus]|uniref:TonB-dependent receptor n=1 Tax=Candidatus Pseudobacter hemicellulosilyticus TaxID=3121375 RepID=A0AAJ5WMI0_9BACT|nr:MAG: TonB-dependent receptor [Pseudobacter sp.]